MAIVVEREKKSSHIFSVAGWVVFLLAVIIAVYYIFLAPVPAVTLPAAGGLNTLAPLTKSAVQPQDVESLPALQALHTTVAAPTSTGPASVTRQNPFIAP